MADGSNITSARDRAPSTQPASTQICAPGAELLTGLRARPKRLPTKYLYDAEGSRLFERICELPEYYPTRTETAILRENAAEIARLVGPDALLLELGSGASTKTRILIEHLERLVAYMPIDISRSALDAATARLRSRRPELEVLPVCADFTRPFSLPNPKRTPDRTLVFFPGSTIGNFVPEAARKLLADIRRSAGPRASLLIGADLVKDPTTLVRAYDDAQGVTAAFDLNILRRVNRECGADFDLHAFRHVALWNAEEARIEMHLVSTKRQDVQLGDATIEFDAGEHLVTEFSHKYTLETFGALARSSGWDVVRTWTDARRLFSVHYCMAIDPAPSGEHATI